MIQRTSQQQETRHEVWTQSITLLFCSSALYLSHHMMAAAPMTDTPSIMPVVATVSKPHKNLTHDK
jgi:hypothetical protein